MRESVRIISQCLRKIPGGLIRSQNNKIINPFRKYMKRSMESIIHHFIYFTKNFNLINRFNYVII
jgi:NADH-quinone oxidoreductase subunit D